MKFKKTRPALLVALALQQLCNPAFAQTSTNDGKNDKSADAAQLPEIKVNSQKVTDDFAASSFAGFRTPTPLRDIPQTITVVNRALMDSQAIASLSEALRNVPGITVGGAEGGQIGNNINLRGFTARTDMYLNGMRDTGQYYRDTYYLESVEVLKGPSSMLFGRGSTGGVINQVSKRPLLGDANQVTGTIDTNGGVRSTGDFNRQLSDTSAVRVVMMGQKAQTTRDVIVNRDFGIAPSLRFGIGTQTEVTLSAILSHNDDMVDYGIPAVNGHPVKGNRDTFYGLRDDRTLQNTAILSGLVEHKLNSNVTLRSQLQYSHYNTDALTSGPTNVGTLVGNVFTALPTAALGNTTALPLSALSVRLTSHDRIIKNEMINNQTDLIAKFDTGFLKHTMIAGVAISRETSNILSSARSNLPVVSLINPSYLPTPANSVKTIGNEADASATQVGAYINDTIELNKQWKLVGGVRWDRFKADLTNTISTATPPLLRADQTVNFTSVRGGVIYQPDNVQSYYVSYGTSFNPSLETLAATAGTQSLAPEKSRSYEIGTKWDVLDGNLSLTSALFDIEKTNSRSQISPGIYISNGDVRVTGFEFGAAGRITRNWQLMGGYTHLNPTIVRASALENTQGKDLANTPRDMATLWTTYKLTPQWEAGGGATYMSERFGSNTNVVSAAGYTRWDGTVAYHLPKYDIRLNLLNLTNREYISSLVPSGGGRAVPGSGRTALITIAHRF
ncbi:Iron transport receptor protein [Candidatus Nitrotoga sp. HW29]|uniref:TonB-dependent receptor n=1 Tax=Candidatus Nitrotoga sp. HW29 TaxID=2886963 RepID=UPI001EF1EEF3|nr:TonB-dependent siderophore receptor [Candidatus Nitrotoga sp. HW29]CAH1904994.1 Iron transport receptor protein [Candidatus Nitrotoga sp. HW29]